MNLYELKKLMDRNPLTQETQKAYFDKIIKRLTDDMNDDSITLDLLVDALVDLEADDCFGTEGMDLD